MILNQRSVVDVNFLFPDNVIKAHPVIVLSVPSVLECEGTFVGVPISHSPEWYDDTFSFPLFDNMFEKKLLNQNSFARLHLISSISLKDLSQQREVNKMKTESFNAMFWQIEDLIFGCS